MWEFSDTELQVFSVPLNSQVTGWICWCSSDLLWNMIQCSTHVGKTFRDYRTLWGKCEQAMHWGIEQLRSESFISEVSDQSTPTVHDIIKAI